MHRDSFRRFIDGLKLRWFEAEELLIGVDRQGNHFPPPELWPNVVPTIVVLDELREHLGKPIVISSAYRGPVYNRRVGGAIRSQHLVFGALDFSVSRMSAEAVGEVLKAWRGLTFNCPRFERLEVPPVPFKPLQKSDGGTMFKLAGGLGVYTRFIHFDTRGVNATWRGH